MPADQERTRLPLDIIQYETKTYLEAHHSVSEIYFSSKLARKSPRIITKSISCHYLSSSDNVATIQTTNDESSLFDVNDRERSQSSFGASSHIHIVFLTFKSVRIDAVHFLQTSSDVTRRVQR
jgi:hypothetical protein